MKICPANQMLANMHTGTKNAPYAIETALITSQLKPQMFIHLTLAQGGFDGGSGEPVSIRLMNSSLLIKEWMFRIAE